MNLKTKPKVLECLLAVNLDVHIWSARRKLSPDDFTHAELPPEGLASLGSKKICDPKELKIFGTLKSRAVSLLSKSGVRFLGGWAIPEGKAPDMIHQLEIIAKEFIKAKNDFISRYDKTVAEWIKGNPGWESIIASSTVSADYVAKRIDFNWQVFKVVNPPEIKDSKVNKGLSGEVAKLGNTLFDEVAKQAQDTWKRSYLGKTEITRKALSPLKQLHSKLTDLSFIEPKVAPVALLIATAVTSLPKRGAITGNSLLRLKGLVSLLSDTEALLNYAKEMMDGRDQENVLDSLMSSAPSRKTKPKTKEPVTDKPKLVSLGLW
ncbi:DUF3150 domain-containing protein [Lentisphaera marina]|uniref:DUF3150 domain-containing protein n=1 Tax=Lentisphaera marina TaxID=1111041 RepID=UPI0023658834|nr:DUF3150 domain-containing protein [Lentisphaera marina]MDD7984375.1 DUF3150 domain-containing protein [Lentisphaera marina]